MAITSILPTVPPNLPASLPPLTPAKRDPFAAETIKSAAFATPSLNPANPLLALDRARVVPSTGNKVKDTLKREWSMSSTRLLHQPLNPLEVIGGIVGVVGLSSGPLAKYVFGKFQSTQGIAAVLKKIQWPLTLLSAPLLLGGQIVSDVQWSKWRKQWKEQAG